MMRILLLTDSLGCPRKEIPVEKTWTNKLMNTFSSSDVIFYTYCEHGLSGQNVNINYIGEICPDIIICQLGIVDASRRALSKREQYIFSKIPIISKYINIFCRRYHYVLSKIRNIHYTSVEDFDSIMKEIADKTRKLFFLEIAPPGKCLIEMTYNIEKDVEIYNNVMRLSVDSKFDFLTLYQDCNPDNILLNDGHHLNYLGNELVYGKVCEALNNYLKETFCHRC